VLSQVLERLARLAGLLATTAAVARRLGMACGRRSTRTTRHALSRWPSPRHARRRAEAPALVSSHFRTRASGSQISRKRQPSSHSNSSVTKRRRRTQQGCRHHRATCATPRRLSATEMRPGGRTRLFSSSSHTSSDSRSLRPNRGQFIVTRPQNHAFRCAPRRKQLPFSLEILTSTAAQRIRVPTRSHS
jgi:hypothetical protein